MFADQTGQRSDHRVLLPESAGTVWFEDLVQVTRTYNNRHTEGSLTASDVLAEYANK